MTARRVTEIERVGTVVRPDLEQDTAAANAEEPGPDKWTADEVRRLLIGYAVALDAADSLPTVIRIASRPRRYCFFDAFRRLPRLTIGTHSIVTHHVRRSTAAISRRYGMLAATRGLTDEEKRASELVNTFHASLPEVRWKLIIPAGLIAVFLTFRLLLEGIAGVISDAVRSLDSEGASADVVRALAESVIRSGAAVPTPGSFIDLFAQFGTAGLAEWLTLAATIGVATYLVVRPLSPAFRIKRILFNLAPSGDVDLGRTTMTWNVSRSVGLYQLERGLCAHLGARVPREIDVDLWISAVPAAILAWVLWPGRVLIPETEVAFAGIVVLSAGLVAIRLTWLLQTRTARRRTVGPADPAAGFRTSCGNVVEARSIVETAALGFASFIVGSAVPLESYFVVPSPVWVRLVRERRDLQRARGRPVARAPRALGGVWPALGSALLLWLLPPVALYIHLTVLARLQGPNVGSARFTRAWLIPLAAVVNVVVLVDITPVVGAFTGPWHGSSIILASAMYIAAFAAVQHEHNTLARDVGVPLAFDEPQCDDVLAMPKSAYTPWVRRVLASILDLTPILVVVGAGVGIAIHTSKFVCKPGWCESVASDTGRVALIVALLLVSAYAIWNLAYRQGTTGSSVGKSILKFRLLNEKTEQPIGFGLSTLRQLIHALSFVLVPLSIGYLWPLWDAKRQTWTDKFMSTVCVPTRRAAGNQTADAHQPVDVRATEDKRV